MLSEEIYNVSDEKIIKKHYKEIKKKYDDLKDKICENEILISELLCNDDVNTYLELSENRNVVEYLEKCDEVEKLRKDKDFLHERLTFLHQQLCEHPAYFVLDEINNDTFNEKYITCSCIECGKNLTKNIDNLDDIYLIYPKNIKNSKSEYKEYKKEYKRLLKRIAY